jgi:hypothetical protein
MLEFLGAFIAKALEKILNVSIDLGKKSFLDRRKTFRKFFDLYEALLALEATSQEMYREFLGYARGTEIITRTVPRDKIKKLSDTLDDFIDAASRISPLLEIYDDNLVITLNDVA